ncbi:zinc finger protein OZF-like [Phlebotomus argentipes]|uniref:zinc finger protein OZF-like n=1 Tax=Phlebotomus argentipes TaxID=94469 RepID=UPI002892F1AD|nr:zinc finger protein OZF-like [Phlebotomus argentipes]
MEVKEEKDDFHLDYSIVKEEYVFPEDESSVKDEEEGHQQNSQKHIFPCTICGKLLKTQQSLKGHIARHGTDTKFECEQCGRAFNDKHDMRRHIQRIHSQLPGKRFSCQHCEKVFYNRTLFERHVSVHSQTKDIECSLCAKKFKHERNLREHLHVHRQDKPFVCGVCGKGFKKKSALTQHGITHLGRNVNCFYCKAPMRSQEGLRKHITVLHRGLPVDPDDPPVCTICKEAFQTLEALKDHTRKHPSEEMSRCEMCEKEFLDEKAVQRHIHTYHEKQSNKKAFSCSHCDKSFPRNYNLLRHLEIHKKDRPLLSCKVCGAKHVQAYSLKRHELMHEIEGKAIKTEDLNIRD